MQIPQDPKELLASGILNLYVLGLLDSQASQQVDEMIARYPEVAAAYNAIRQEIDEYASLYIDEQPKYLQTAGIGTNQLARNLSYVALVISMLFNVLLFLLYYWQSEKNRSLEAHVSLLSTQQIAWKADVEDEHRLLLHEATYVVPLHNPQSDHQQEAIVVWNAKTGEALIFSAWLPAPPQGKQYQLWMLSEDGCVMDAGVFELYKVCRAKAHRHVKEFIITLEKVGGVARAEGPVVASGTIAG